MKKVITSFTELTNQACVQVANWYRGEIISSPPIITDTLVILSMPEIKRHWTANTVHFCVDSWHAILKFICKNWQFCIATIVTIVMARW